MQVFLLLLFAGVASASSLDFGTLYYSRQPELFRLLTKYRLWPPGNTWNSGQLLEPSEDKAVAEPFIIGGDSSSIYDFPYQLSLRNGGVHICGASVIAERWALTAAHCLDDGTLPTWITFRGGSPHRLSGGAIFHALDYHLHDQFNRQTLDYDVAVVQVQESFYVDPIEPVRLADSSMIFPVPANAVVTGWGTAEDGFVPLILQSLEVYTQTKAVCMTAWIDQITDRMLCAGGGSVGKDVCNGDSGGPLLVNGYQVGLVSWGSDTCAINLPGIYTSLLDDEVRNFIRMVTDV